MGAAGMSRAAPAYDVQQILIPPDQKLSGPKEIHAPVYQPHDTSVELTPDVWVSSNEASRFGGITVFDGSTNEVLSNLNIDEPGVNFHGTHGEYAPGRAKAEGAAENAAHPANFPAVLRVNPTVCLPVMLPPGTRPPTLEGLPVRSDPRDPHHRICAPLGTRMHARYPHGIDIDKVRGRVYQIIENSGLKWNADRRAFEVAQRHEDEAGLLLMYDIRDPRAPEIVSGYLLGHGAYELAVNERNGLVFVGNMQDTPGVTPNNWVSVINPDASNPYGFIDVGWGNAVRGIQVDEVLNVVFGGARVGEKLFAFDGSCVPQPNAHPDEERRMGENCILYSVDVRHPFFAQVPEAEAIFAKLDAYAEEECLPAVLHLHDVNVDRLHHRTYLTLHYIGGAENTGLPEERRCRQHRQTTGNGLDSNVEREVAPGMPPTAGRWVVEVDTDPLSKDFKQVRFIDLSNGENALEMPTILAVPPGTPFEKQFVHVHWVGVDPQRGTLLVSGEETGNLGVVDAETGKLRQVIGISQRLPGAPADCGEAHVHGVQINKLTGQAYVTDEGQAGCYAESITILKPRL